MQLGQRQITDGTTRRSIGPTMGARIAATVTASILGGAHIVRIHDVVEMAQVARIADLLLNPRDISEK